MVCELDERVSVFFSYMLGLLFGDVIVDVIVMGGIVDLNDFVGLML